MKKNIAYIVLLLIIGATLFFYFNQEEKKLEGLGRLTVLQEPRPFTAEEVNHLNSFSIRLYDELFDDDNLFFSPVSIYMAMGMTYNGAFEDSEAEFEKLLGLKQTALNDFNRELQYRVLGYQDIAFNLANSLWIRDSYKNNVLSDFLDKNQEYYGAMVSYLDFSKQSSIDTINNWVKENTEGLIAEVIEEIHPLTVMFLINTIYFKADWVFPFEKDMTYQSDFFSSNGVIEVDMMQQQAYLGYYEDDDLQAVLLPYEGEETAMFVLLPQNNSINFQSLEKYLNEMKENKVMVDLHMPKVEINYKVSLKEAFQNLGMKTSFTPLADFSKMASNAKEDGLHIADVLHEAVLIIDEKGTEAAAVTSVEMRVESIMIPDVLMKVDRPYVVGIIDLDSNSILFKGYINNPNE